MTKDANNTQVDVLQQIGRSFGQRLGYLIASINLTDEVREDLLILLPEMTGQQILDLSNILEDAYLNHKTIDIDEKLTVELNSLADDYNNKESSLLAETNDKLDSLLNKIKSVAA
ncbi:MAG: hypothetical protein HY973_03340 [Candidatus Kerfeldbacteria bacterium]|nr:hypothetical protein [Candidatus Kerfeldbacteria bacterium]